MFELVYRLGGFHGHKIRFRHGLAVRVVTGALKFHKLQCGNRYYTFSRFYPQVKIVALERRKQRNEDGRTA